MKNTTAPSGCCTTLAYCMSVAVASGLGFTVLLGIVANQVDFQALAKACLFSPGTGAGPQYPSPGIG